MDSVTVALWLATVAYLGNTGLMLFWALMLMILIRQGKLPDSLSALPVILVGYTLAFGTLALSLGIRSIIRYEDSTLIIRTIFVMTAIEGALFSGYFVWKNFQSRK